MFLGYVRIIFMLVSFYFMPFNPWIAVSLYLTSEFLDAFDGHAARALNQCILILLFFCLYILVD